MLLVGWVSFAIQGVFYHLFHHVATGWLASSEPIEAVGSIGLLTSMLLFAFIAFPILAGRSE